jgi:histidine triad (HIT) family protein
MTDCVFCAIAAGETPCHKVWEDGRHLAFLSIFPNTAGCRDFNQQGSVR